MQKTKKEQVLEKGKVEKVEKVVKQSQHETLAKVFLAIPKDGLTAEQVAAEVHKRTGGQVNFEFANRKMERLYTEEKGTRR